MVCLIKPYLKWNPKANHTLEEIIWVYISDRELISLIYKGAWGNITDLFWKMVKRHEQKVHRKISVA